VSSGRNLRASRQARRRRHTGHGVLAGRCAGCAPGGARTCATGPGRGHSWPLDEVPHICYSHDERAYIAMETMPLQRIFTNSSQTARPHGTYRALPAPHSHARFAVLEPPRTILDLFRLFRFFRTTRAPHPYRPLASHPWDRFPCLRPRNEGGRAGKRGALHAPGQAGNLAHGPSPFRSTLHVERSGPHPGSAGHAVRQQSAPSPCMGSGVRAVAVPIPDSRPPIPERMGFPPGTFFAGAHGVSSLRLLTARRHRTRSWPLAPGPYRWPLPFPSCPSCLPASGGSILSERPFPFLAPTVTHSGA
jgi:hypothetical protein